MAGRMSRLILPTMITIDDHRSSIANHGPSQRDQGEGAFTVALSCTMTGYLLLLLLGTLETRWPLYAFIVSYGFAQGAGGIAIAAKTVEVFHGPRLGTIFMVVALSGHLEPAFSAWIGGRFFDLTSS